MMHFGQLSSRQYINLETFRKNGLGVKTPVWFVQQGDTFFICTIANSGKVKRIRNCEKVNVAPCKVDGTPLGDWLPAQAREVKDEATLSRVDRLLDEKYGLLKKMFALATALQGRRYTVLEVKVSQAA